MQHYKVFSSWRFPGWGKFCLKPKHEKKIREYFRIPDYERVFLAFDADVSFFGPSRYGFALCSTGVYASNIGFERFKKVPEHAYRSWDECTAFDVYTFEFVDVDSAGEMPASYGFFQRDPDGLWIHLFGYDYLVDCDRVRFWLVGLGEALRSAKASG